MSKLDYDLAEAAAELVRRTTKAQGLPLVVEDPAALRRLAAVLNAAALGQTNDGRRK